MLNWNQIINNFSVFAENVLAIYLCLFIIFLSFILHVMRVFCMHSILLDSEDTPMRKMQRIPALQELNTSKILVMYNITIKG